MSIFKKIQSRRADRKNRARLQELSKAFATFDNFVQSNLLYWDPRNRRLFIAEPLAIVYIGQGLKAWRNFLNNVFLWETNKLQQSQWQEYIMSAQAKAVRERRATGYHPNKAEVERIRRAVSDNISSTSVELPPIKPFEFFIIWDSVNDPKRKDILWVGQYDPDTQAVDMAEWSDVQAAVQQQQAKKDNNA